MPYFLLMRCSITMIDFDNISKRYANGCEALSQISFHLNKGEMAFLTGHSGAGKSTLLKLIALLEKPSNGDIIINGQNLTRIGKREIPYIRRQIGLIFQNSRLLFDRSVFDNVALPLVIQDYRYQEIKKRTRAALDKVGLLNKEKLLPETLSCGEQQRISIARAIVSKPPIILADEPTGNLDPDLSTNILQLFEQFNQAGVTVLIASHDVTLINQLNYRILDLKAGHLI